MIVLSPHAVFYISETCFHIFPLNTPLIIVWCVHISHCCTHWQMSKHRSGGLSGFSQSHVSGKWNIQVQCYPIISGWLGFFPWWLPANMFPCYTHQVKTPRLSMFEIFSWFNFFFLLRGKYLLSIISQLSSLDVKCTFSDHKFD